MEKIKVISDDQIKGALTFQINDLPQLCPFATPFIIPARLQGQSPEVMYINCKNTCAHCSISEYEISITCGGTKVIHKITDSKDVLKLSGL